MSKRADPHRARGSALCGQWLLLYGADHKAGAILACLGAGLVRSRLCAVGGIKRLAGDKVCENSVFHSWTPFLVGNSHRRFPLASSRPHDVSPGAHVREGRRTRWPRILGQGVRRPYGTRGYVISHGGYNQGPPGTQGPLGPPEPFVPLPRGTRVPPRGWARRGQGCPEKNQNLIMGTRFEK